MLHYGTSFYFSFVSNSLSVKNVEAVCDLGMYVYE